MAKNLIKKIRDFEYRAGYLSATIIGINGYSFYHSIYKPNCKHPKRVFKRIVKQQINAEWGK